MPRPHNLRPAWVDVDLSAVRSNVRHLAGIDPNRSLRAVVKADAYGHGAVEVARVIAGEGIERFAVALVEEGIELRRAGVEGSILTMGMSTAGQCELARHYDLTPAISSLDQLESWAGVAAGRRTPTEIHLKVNTGMNRLGLSPDELPEALRRVRASTDLHLTGFMSHFADGHSVESDRTSRQLELFVELLSLLTPIEVETAEIHIGNSAAFLHHDLGPTTAYRPGLALFGYDPARQHSGLNPALSVHGRIVRLHHVAPGERVGYEGQWAAERPSRIGVIPLGYADGYSWRLGGRSQVLISGQRAPVVGTVSMDMLAVDLTDTDAGEGDETTLLGVDGSDAIDAYELADLAGVPIFEILCGFGLRLPRVFVEGGRPVSTSDRFGISTTPER